MLQRLGRFVDSDLFQNAILAVISLAAILVGLETSRDLMARHGDLLHALDRLILWVFVLEAALKTARHGRHW
jgi:voltage-gated sodium channel